MVDGRTPENRGKQGGSRQSLERVMAGVHRSPASREAPARAAPPRHRGCRSRSRLQITEPRDDLQAGWAGTVQVAEEPDDVLVGGGCLDLGELLRTGSYPQALDPTPMVLGAMNTVPPDSPVSAAPPGRASRPLKSIPRTVSPSWGAVSS